MHFTSRLLVQIIALISVSGGGFRFAFSEELLELSCSNDCKQFQNATCIDNVCVCHNVKEDGRTAVVACEPKDDKQSNIIGGKCPCSPQAECKASENACYCQENFTASKDKLRCIPEFVLLNGDCELDSQCHQADPYAVCQNKICVCSENFVAKDNACVSLVDPILDCKNDSDCKSFGNGVECDEGLHRCKCADSFVKAKNEKKCLRTLKYKENCFEHQQCQKRLGPGGICKENVCECAEKYYALNDTNPNNNDNSNSSEMMIKCKRILELGEYCRSDADCFQGHMEVDNATDDTESIACIFGECRCKQGYYTLDDGACMRSNVAPIIDVISTIVLVQLIALTIYLAF